MNSGKLRVSYGKNGNRSLENPYEALANLYPGGGKMQSSTIVSFPIADSGSSYVGPSNNALNISHLKK